jgi:hypothetical protein
VPLIPAINHRRFRCYWRLIIACPVTTTSAIIISGVVYNVEQLIGGVIDKVAMQYLRDFSEKFEMIPMG